MNKTPSEQIIDYFGGIRPMAQKLEISHTTVQGWAKRKMIPAQRFDAIESAALQYNLGGKVIPLLNTLKKAMSSSDFMDAEGSNLTDKSEKDISGSSDTDGVPGQTFTPRPLPEYTFQPHNKSQFAGSFFVSMISVSLAIGILIIMFFAPDLLPQNEKQRQYDDYYLQQNAQMSQQLNQYKDTIDLMADRMFELAKTTQSIEQELGVIREEALSSNARSTQDEQYAKLANIEQTINSLKDSNNQLQTMVGQMEQSYGDADNGALEEIHKMVDNVNMQLSAMQADVAGQTGNEYVESTIIEQSSQQLDEARMASLVESTGGIANALENGGSFNNELEIINALVGTDPAMSQSITKLKPFAESGVPQSKELSKLLDILSGDILAASPEYRNLSIAKKAKLELDKLISVRKKDEMPQGDGSAIILKRAKLYLEANQIAAAQAELSKLDPEAAKVALPITEKMAVAQVANVFLNQLEKTLHEYIPSTYMNGIVKPWLDATRDAAQLKFKDPRSIKAPVPKFMNNDNMKLRLK